MTSKRHEMMGLDTLVERPITRRALLTAGAGAGLLASVGALAVRPVREAMAATQPPDIQFDLANFIPAAITVNDGAGNVTLRFATVFTTFATYQLTRTPNENDQSVLAGALQT